jgi:3-oxoacyl-[acyl-carrier protein] reductase
MLQNKIAIITGAAAGIGEGTAEFFAAHGARLALLDKDADRVIALAARLGGGALAIPADVRSRGEVDAAFAAIGKHFDGLADILINNAGIYPRRPFAETTEDELETILDVNLKSAYRCTQAALPLFEQRGGGKVVNTGSVTFFVGFQNLSHYIAAKGGIVGLTRALARELGPRNIYVNCVSPGAVLVETEKTVATPEQMAAIVENQSLKRRLLPIDIARVSAFLASGLSDGMTGQTLNVDGGWIMY